MKNLWKQQKIIIFCCFFIVTFRLHAQPPTGTNLASPLSNHPPAEITGKEGEELKSALAYLRRGSVKMKSEDWEGARADFTKAIEIEPQNAIAYTMRAAMESRLRNFDEAYRDSSKAIILDKEMPLAYNQRAIVEADAYRNYEAATADYEKSIEIGEKLSAEKLTARFLRPEDKKEMAAIAFLNLSLIKRHNKDLPGAIKDVKKVIELAPELAHAYVVRGYFQNDSFQLQAALESFRRAIDLDSKEERSYCRIWLIRTRVGEAEAATEELTEHLKNMPAARRKKWPVPEEIYLIGQQTEEEFLETANNAPGSGRYKRECLCEAYYNIGMKHLLGGDKSGATGFFKKSIEVGFVSVEDYESAEVELEAVNKAPR